MNQNRRFLLAMVITTVLLYGIGTVAAHYGLSEIAPSFTGDRAFNQKVKFIRDHMPGPGPVAVVIGSSMALSNVDSDELQRAEGRPWINLGIWGLSITETAGVFDLFHSLFPAREVVLATQFFELSDADRNVMKMEPGVFRDYVQHHFSWLEEFAYRDVVDALRQRWSWNTLGGNPHDPESLVFTATGAIPVQVFDGPAGPHRWSQFESYIGNCKACTANIVRLCQAVRQQKIPFTVFIPPVTRASRMQKNGVQAWYEIDRRRIRTAVEQCGGRVFDVADVVDMADNCFFDFAHLNSQGMHVVGPLFESWRQGKLLGYRTVNCTASGVPQITVAGQRNG